MTILCACVFQTILRTNNDYFSIQIY